MIKYLVYGILVCHYLIGEQCLSQSKTFHTNITRVFKDVNLPPFDWETEQILERNREPMRAYAHQYKTSSKIKSFSLANSDYMSLNGNWRFAWSRDFNSSPKHF